ncbi:MAG: cytochrome c3 family protein [Deltaproteobacteria bacterium]|nr:cytochrome c3 family protein [Deltaproteobacteria bacterium]
MKKRTLILVAACAAAVLFAGHSLWAACESPDTITMENAAVKEHTKPIVEFSHKKHHAEYGEACGECHHNDKGEPLSLKEGDCVKPCISCHEKASDMPREEKRGLRGLSPAERRAKQLEYYVEAVHMNCIDCHKKYNKEKGVRGARDGGAPASCTECHAK